MAAIRVEKITVCGGGNGAQALIPIAASNLGCPVDVFAPYGDEAERLAGEIQVTDAVEARARPRRASADPAEVIPGSRIVVLVMPAFAHESTLREIVPFLDHGAWVGAIPARSGLDYCAAHVLADNGRDDVGVFGLQTLPWACRIREFGRSVHVLGLKRRVDAAGRPAAGMEYLAPLLSRMLGLTVESAGNMLALTLANTGQLIHPGIMYGLFAGWDGAPLDESTLFYHGLNHQGAEVLGELSDEMQAIRARLETTIDLSAVRPLLDWLVRSYGTQIEDARDLYTSFRSNRAYAGLKAPMREVSPGQYMPDFTARYLTEDVPFGLAVVRAIGEMAQVETPAMDTIVAWTGDRLGRDYRAQDRAETRIPQNFGLSSAAELVRFALDR